VSLRSYNNYIGANNTYYKANLIKVIDIFILDPILSNYIIYEVKLPLNKLRIFIFSSLVVILVANARLNAGSLLNKVQYLVLADSVATALRDQEISHISNISNPRGKASRIHVEDASD